MAFERPITIKEALDKVQNRSYALPSIQRELVWRTDQIERLFDSVMQGYPIGSFLFWHVDSQTVQRYNWYDFVLDYDERAPHNQRTNPAAHGLTAVLDGQQRLTAFNIALNGSHTTRQKGRWSRRSESFQKKHLYLNLLRDISDEPDEDGTRYEFRFLTADEASKSGDDVYWYPVRDIMDVRETIQIINAVYNLGLSSTRGPLTLLTRLHDAIHKNPTVAYYLEECQDLHRVLTIFVRTNSGGTELSYSDILMSIATAQWDKYDAREEIHGFVDEINQTGQGFRFSKDFVLKACLMLSDIGSIAFRVDNFNRDNMSTIQDVWEQIEVSVQASVNLASSFGLSRETLSATNALLPIAYFLHKSESALSVVDRNEFEAEREQIRLWLIASLIKPGIWGSGLDTLLMSIRDAISDNLQDGFPRAAIEEAMRRRGKDLSFDDDDLDLVLDSQYRDRRTFGILTLLYPFVDVRRNQFEVDHVFPRGQLTVPRLRSAGVPDSMHDKIKDRINGIANLQLLADDRNRNKGDMLPSKWLHDRFTDAATKEEHKERHDLGDPPSDIREFVDWYDARRERMLDRLRGILGQRPS